MKKKNTFPPVKAMASNGPAKQYNAIVNFVKEKKFGVQAGHFAEYCDLVSQFSAVLWEIDPHYHKLQARGKKFPTIVEKNFLGFLLLHSLADFVLGIVFSFSCTPNH